MNKIFLLSILLSLFLSCTKNDQEEAKSNSIAWKKVFSKKGKFCVSFPNYIVKEKRITQIIDGENVYIYGYSMNTQNTNDENLGYTINYSFWPNVDSDDLINKKFDIERDKIISVTNSILEYENVIDTLNYPGRDLFLTIDNTKVKARYRMYFNDGILYKLAVITEDSMIFNKSVSRFFNSFEILKNEMENTSIP